MTININELRRLAQAATPGPWVAKNVSGAGLEIHMIHPLYPDKEWPAFGTDSAFCKKGLVSYETWTQFPHEVQNVQQSKNAEYIAAANPAVINELLDRLEAAEKSDAESIAMYRKARDERDTLRAKIETAENDAAHQKALAASALRVAEGWERKCGELRAEVIYWKEQKEPGAAGWRALARILQAKIDAMEKQEPVAWLHETRRDSDVVTDAVKHVWGRVAVGSMAAYSIPLYTLPGAKGEEK